MKKGFNAFAIVCLTLIFLLHSGVTSAGDNVVFPQDEGPHPDIPIEWWYFTGHLEGKDLFGRTHLYGFEVMINRSDALGTEPKAALYNAHLAITDITRGKFKARELVFGIQKDVVLPDGGFAITVGNKIHIDGKNGVNHITSRGFADFSYRRIDFTLAQSEPAALHGDGGIIPYGEFGESYYYSQTKLNVSGSLIDHGIPVRVTGIAWMDHQWGTWEGGQGGWEWFSIQLDNNTEYMLYFIHNGDYEIIEKVGTLVNADGTTTNLDPDLMANSPLGTWTSPDTGTTYQMDWKVSVPGGTLTITSELEEQEVWNPFISVINYWEGSCAVTGTINGQPVTGQAYTEQTKMMTMGDMFGN